MKEEDKDIELRSEEFQEILGDIPHWILRRGIMFVSFAVLVLVVGSSIFKYPDVITTTMTLTGSTPPAEVVAKMSGKLEEFYVKDKEKVKIGDYLAVIETPSKKEDIFLLKEFLDYFNLENMSSLSPGLHLGSFQTLYSSFYQCLSEYQEFKRLQYYEQKATMIKEQLTQYEDYYENLNRQKIIIKKKFALQEKQFYRDSVLKEKKILSDEEFETSKKRYLDGVLSVESILATIQTTATHISEKKEILLDIQQQYLEKKHIFETQLESYSAQLLSDIHAWEQKCVLMAPVDGVVTFTTYWVKNQNVVTGDVVFTIIPSGNNTLLGKASMSMDRSGKVKIGQKVNVRFYNFPDNEFGIVKGLVKTISVVPTKTNQDVNNYIVEISFPEGLYTTYHKELTYLPGMQAQADIVTEDYSLLERFFMPLRKLFSEGFRE